MWPLLSEEEIFHRVKKSGVLLLCKGLNSTYKELGYNELESSKGYYNEIQNQSSSTLTFDVRIIVCILYS